MPERQRRRPEPERKPGPGPEREDRDRDPMDDADEIIDRRREDQKRREPDRQ